MCYMGIYIYRHIKEYYICDICKYMRIYYVEMDRCCVEGMCAFAIWEYPCKYIKICRNYIYVEDLD